MKPRISCIALLVLGALAVGCSDRIESIEGDDLLVLSGVTLIDGTGAPPVEDAVVVIQGERIYRVGRIGDFRYPDDATVEDLSNRYAIPGLMDLHAHAREAMMETFLAFGITTIRAPGARLEEWEQGAPILFGVELRDRLASGALKGPRMFSAGPLIDVPQGLFDGEGQVGTEAEVREELRRQAATGVDYVKLYMGIPDSMLDAAVRAAHERDIKVLGHLKRTSWSAAAERGIDGLVHSCSEGPTWELIPAEQARFPWNEWGTSLRTWASAADRLDLSGPEMQRLVEALLRNEVEVNPTLATMEALYWADDSEHLEQQAPGFVPPSFTERWSANWQNNRNFMAQWGLNPSEWSQLKQSFVACQQMVRHLHDRGVLLTAGSDVGSWMTPGVSLHRDLELLGEAGISPMDVLRIGTSNGAKALGISEEVGTLEAGRLADIVILRDDPLADIRNTLSIELVIHRGMVLNPAELLAKAQTRQ